MWVNIQVPVPEDLLDAPSLQALAALIINDIEVDTGLAVTTESSFLLPTPPATIQLTGALLGGGNTCPFYHEQQVAMQCGRHVVNLAAQCTVQRKSTPWCMTWCTRTLRLTLTRRTS